MSGKGRKRKDSWLRVPLSFWSIELNETEYRASWGCPRRECASQAVRFPPAMGFVAAPSTIHGIRTVKYARKPRRLMADFLLGFSCWWWLPSVLFQSSIGRVLSFVFDRMLFQVCLYFYCKFLWRCLKFVMRKLTGRCELQRICYNTKPGASRTMKIGKHETKK